MKVNGEDIFTVLSNLFLLITFGAALWCRRWTRAFVFFCMTWVSFVYHLCDSFGACIFSFNMHHHLDFFFAQWLIVLTGLYLVDFPYWLPWLERCLIILGGLSIVVLQITLSAELYVQAALVGAVLVGVIIYWIACGVPKYKWDMLLIGLSLIAGSVLLYVGQNQLPKLYWATHSLWHVAAAVGQTYWLYIKPRGRKYAALDAKVH